VAAAALFGSGARATMHESSDLDLLVVVPDGTHRRRTAQTIYSSIHGLGVPFDIVVATTSDLAHYGDRIGLIYRTILEEGREVHAA
jgi:predicted nucleotidyltransferase